MTRFVAEVGSNWNGDFARALDFVRVAADIGCDAVKFQMFDPEDIYWYGAFDKIPSLSDTKSNHFEDDELRRLSMLAHGLGMEFGVTPFGDRNLMACAPFVDFIKVSSYQLELLEFLKTVGLHGKPVVLSTGMATMPEVERALRALGDVDVIVLHCVSSYPTPPAQACLRAIPKMREVLNRRVGWSDHTKSRMVVARAVNFYKADMVEFHLDLDGDGAEFKHGHCWLPGEIRALMHDTHAYADKGFYACDGKAQKKPMVCESEERLWRAYPWDGLRPSLELRERWLSAKNS